MLLGRITRKIDVYRKEMMENPVRIARRDGRIEVKNVRKVGNRIVIDCLYEVSYKDEKGEEYAKISIEGEIVSDEEILLKEWEKDKALTAMNTERILNFFMEEAQIQALNLSKWVGIPTPFNLPRIRIKK